MVSNKFFQVGRLWILVTAVILPQILGQSLWAANGWITMMAWLVHVIHNFIVILLCSLRFIIFQVRL
jgi:hypothetical protein